MRTFTVNISDIDPDEYHKGHKTLFALQQYLKNKYEKRHSKTPEYKQEETLEKAKIKENEKKTFVVRHVLLEGRQRKHSQERKYYKKTQNIC